jgi:ABC-type multidrug transport system fused ATPase/permease subunit
MPWLLRYISKHRFAAIASIASGIFGGLTSALEPYLIGIIIDHVQRGVNLEQIRNDILLLMTMSIMTVLGFYAPVQRDSILRSQLRHSTDSVR